MQTACLIHQCLWHRDSKAGRRGSCRKLPRGSQKQSPHLGEDSCGPRVGRGIICCRIVGGDLEDDAHPVTPHWRRHRQAGHSLRYHIGTCMMVGQEGNTQAQLLSFSISCVVEKRWFHSPVEFAWSMKMQMRCRNRDVDSCLRRKQSYKHSANKSKRSLMDCTSRR